jgi:hypothetical protein
LKAPGFRREARESNNFNSLPNILRNNGIIDIQGVSQPPPKPAVAP